MGGGWRGWMAAADGNKTAIEKIEQLTSVFSHYLVLFDARMGHAIVG
jgi:hypothetical protein